MSQSTISGQQIVETLFGRVGYCDEGPASAAPSLVFLQGFLAAPDVWSEVVAQLATTFRCVTVDWPFGAHQSALRSDADLSPPGIARLVVEVLDILDISSAVLVGNDSGGVIAQLVLATGAERIDAAVLVSCDAFECFPPGPYRHLFRLAAFPGVVWLLARAMTWPVVARSRFGFGAVINREPAAARRWAIRLSEDRAIRSDVRKLMVGSSNAQTLGAAEAFASFDRPVLVVWAEADRLFPRSLGERLAAAFTLGRFAVVADSATFVPNDQPGALADLIREFLT